MFHVRILYQKSIAHIFFELNMFFPVDSFLWKAKTNTRAPPSGVQAQVGVLGVEKNKPKNEVKIQNFPTKCVQNPKFCACDEQL